ncbi:MAG TPA: restriction endonuclease [Solirubrobacteraceae bacterium]|jgi:hypothetical protein|nr:restriction endonuclease [Solirubrobacteraceae bacterium]
MSTAIEDLHGALFGFRPAKEGAAYERLSAVVLATLGWQDVAHDTTESAPGKLAAHQLDVTGRHPSGEIRRLIVECKDWDEVVGKGTLDTLVGVCAQLNPDGAAVITTKGYTTGAIAVAVDENIALLRLRAFDPENPTPYVKTIVLTIEPVTSTYSDINIELMPDHGLPPGTEFRAQAAGNDYLLHLDGSQAETFRELLQGQEATVQAEAGSYPRRIAFSDGRLLPVGDGATVPVAALSWTETVHRGSHTTRTERQGDPMLVLEQLNEKGELEHDRVVIDRDLFAWDIDDHGNVTQRGQLGSD